MTAFGSTLRSENKSSPTEKQLDIFQPMIERRVESREQKASYKVAGLFSGIGGIELGLSKSGHHASLFCEIEPGAQAVLKARFPDVPVVPDVTRIESLPVDSSLVAAGFPCQDLSQAGKTAGISGRNSGLVTHVFRLLETQRIPVVLLENVSFMLRLARGDAMRFVIEQLERLGYDWAYRVMDAQAFGLPQRRERVYLVASLPGAVDPRDVLLSIDHGPPSVQKDYRKTANGFYWTEGIRGLGWAVDGVPTLKGGSTIGIASPPAIWLPSGEIIKPDIRDGERLQGFPADWTAPALAVARPGMRWKLVGNAVSVVAAEWLGRQLADPRPYDSSTDRPLEPRAPWPDAAWSVGRQRFVAGVSRWPEAVRSKPLASFLQYPGIPLSERATAGFLSRTTHSSLRFPEGLIPALKRHLARVAKSAAAA